MQKALMMTLALALAACGTDLYGGGTGGTTNNSNASSGTPSCDQLQDGTFASVDDQPIGQRCQFDAQQNYQCTDLSGTWNITFDQGEVFWDVGTQVTSGTYSCKNGTVTATIEGDTFQGTLIGTALTWDGLRYRQ